MRTGRAPSYPDRSRVLSVRSAVPSMPYMIWSVFSSASATSAMK